jgi:hypothetical protein
MDDLTFLSILLDKFCNFIKPVELPAPQSNGSQAINQKNQVSILGKAGFCAIFPKGQRVMSEETVSSDYCRRHRTRRIIKGLRRRARLTAMIIGRVCEAG